MAKKQPQAPSAFAGMQRRLDAVFPWLIPFLLFFAVTGTSRVTVSRILSRFRKAGIIAQDYRRIRILDARRLSEVFSSLGYFLD